MHSIGNFLAYLIEIYSWLLIIYIFMSWVPNARESKFGQILANICEPYLNPFRKIIPPLGMIDISPIVAIFALRFASAGALTLFNMF
ncbi:YggT family protein [Bacillus taeanensis]|uniref:YggT family protein n=1 Tax=Bacillus taeanensis TaxID=273032 RepID=A0A366XPB7_9BACI|nr:YggT family protein [Bacillus taeanensis]RBW67358.1 YggT family protein [Bacillus taeanensis]